MKPSRYNYFFEVDGQAILAYNAFTTALAKLSAEEFARLREFCAEPREDWFGDRSLDAFQEDLTKAGFLISDDQNELEQLRLVHVALKERQQAMGLTIVPTLDCNFRCTYCFSYVRRERMSVAVQEALYGCRAARACP